MQFDIVIQLRNPPFGTETTERNLMGRAADEIELLRDALENLLIAIGMGWDLDGVVAKATDALPKDHEATVSEGIISGLEEAVEHASQPDLGPRWSKKS